MYVEQVRNEALRFAIDSICIPENFSESNWLTQAILDRAHRFEAFLLHGQTRRPANDPPAETHACSATLEGASVDEGVEDNSANSQALADFIIGLIRTERILPFEC